MARFRGKDLSIFNISTGFNWNDEICKKFFSHRIILHFGKEIITRV